MGPLLILVCPCFRESVVVTCKIVSFLCTFVNFLLKNVIVFFFGNQISKCRSFGKKQGKTQKRLHHICRLHAYTHFARSIFFFFFFFFFALPILQKLRIFHVWFFFSATPGVDSYLRHFGATNRYENGEQNLSGNVYYWYLFTLMQIL